MTQLEHATGLASALYLIERELRKLEANPGRLGGILAGHVNEALGDVRRARDHLKGLING